MPIDPWLRTLSFWDGDRPVAALNAYATHPMSSYGRGAVFLDSMSFLTSASISDSRSAGSGRPVAGEGLGLPLASGVPQALHALSQSPLFQPHLLQTITCSGSGAAPPASLVQAPFSLRFAL